MKPADLTPAEPEPTGDLVAREAAARGIEANPAPAGRLRLMILPGFATPSVVAELIRRAVKVRP
jgi:hypothetical protein